MLSLLLYIYIFYYVKCTDRGLCSVTSVRYQKTITIIVIIIIMNFAFAWIVAAILCHFNYYS